VIGAIFLAIACLACLLYFIHHIAVSIQASTIVDRIARETERVIDQVFSRTFPGPPAPEPNEPDEPMPGGTPVLAGRSGYIRCIDEEGLLAMARTHAATLRVEKSIGQFVKAGTPVLVILCGGPVPAALQADSLRALDVGPARTMEQDAEFGVLQVVDIALKAISPAVNDPTTALTCIDQLGRILVRVATREPPKSALRTPDGGAVVLRRTSFPRLLDMAFSQIRHHGKSDVAVPLRGPGATTSRSVEKTRR
jgi:uncharacterized membrane protein